MSKLVLVSLLAGCTAHDSLPTSAPSSVRERLEDAPVRMLVAPAASSGSIVVGHYVDGAWQRARVALPIETGAITASLDASGRVVVADFGLGLAALALPLAANTQLTHVRLDLSAPTTSATTWISENAAAATASLALVLSWTLTVDGTATPLADQKLPALPLELALGGDGERVDGTASIIASGKLWSWADLVELDDLSLVLQAASTD